MDKIDSNILDILKANSRESTSQISKKVNLSMPAVAERIRKMEERNIIEKYTIKINRENTNYKLLAFIFVNIDKTESIDFFRNTIIKHKSVLECYHVAGEYDYLLKVLVEDTKCLEDFLTNQLKKIKGVLKSNTIITLSCLKENINI
ncbi:Lrp/AsnC family transcriptional regulator [Clostridium sp. 19966]|uniref:Lrp/AsnC family transcriptional regulator n=1 Tax=Clostridium sp. 19966 TaxID=2768166 RepID=UPI0028DDD4F2|nr:Lrp/AsnC family transcriptional regulator [Clostridium sp. 19966]MDT8719750.1 Lrp/AsnC family transcriptional regulator [Clostridium sp. 19966]